MKVIRELPKHMPDDWLLQMYRWKYRRDDVALELLHVRNAPLEPSHFQRLLAFDNALAITVIEIDGKLYVLDGHHRTWMACIRGEQTIPAVVWIMPADRPSAVSSSDHDR